MSSDTPVLYSMDISPPCRAVLMTIKALSLDVEIKTLDLTKEENKSSSFMHLNHLHKIPTLSHEDLTITDSHAICTYLFNRFSPTSLLYPQSPKSRARVDQMLCFDMCHLFARNSAFMNDFFKNGRNTNNHELVSGIEEIYGFLDKFCMKSKWLAGEQLNHLHKIPTLSHEDLTITDSHAICTYLFNRFSPTSLLYPQSPKSRARVDQMLCFDMCHLFARNSAFMNDFFKNGRNTNNHELVSGIEEIYGFLDKFCMKSKWLAGEQITLADLCCGASVSSAVLLVPLDKILYPSAADWFQRCNEESLFKDVNQPGVENLKKLMKARSSY